MSTKSKDKEIALATIKNAWRKRESLFEPVNAIVTRRGHPLIEDSPGTTTDIIPHPQLSTQVVSIPEDFYIFVEKIVRADSFVNGAINRLTDYTIQNGYKIYFPENKDLARAIEHWMRAHGFYMLMDNFARCGYIFGNTFLWKELQRMLTGAIGRPRKDAPFTLHDHRIVHPAWMFVRRAPTGEVRGYVQKRTIHELGWSKFTTQEMIHVPHRVIADRTYGMGIIEATMRDLHYLRVTENDLAEIIHDYVAPLYHVRCGYANPKTGTFKPASQPSINKVKKYLEGLAPNEDVITDNSVEILSVGAGKDIGNAQPALQHFKQNAMAGLGLPEFFYGTGANISQALAQEMLTIMDNTAHYEQKIISYTMETQFIPYILLELVKDQIVEDIYGKSADKIDKDGLTRADLDEYLTVDQIKVVPRMIFNPLENDQKRHVRLRETLNSGGLTFNEFRGETYREPLDIELSLLGKSYNVGDLPLPIWQGMVQLQIAKINLQGRMGDGDPKEGKGERTPAKSKAGTKSVDGAGQPQATSVKTQKRKK